MRKIISAAVTPQYKGRNIVASFKRQRRIAAEFLLLCRAQGVKISEIYYSKATYSNLVQQGGCTYLVAAARRLAHDNYRQEIVQQLS